MSEPTPQQIASLALKVMQRHQDWTRSTCLQHAYNLWRDAELCIENNLKNEAEEREKDRHAEAEQRAKYRAAACLKCGSDNVYATNLRPWLKCSNCSNSFTVDDATFDDIAKRNLSYWSGACPKCNSRAESVKPLNEIDRHYCHKCGHNWVIDLNPKPAA